MTEFENKLILNEEAFQVRFFSKVPEYKKTGSAYVLTNGCRDDILIDDRTTGKQIREGKYTKLVEISTAPYMKEIRFDSPGKELGFSFEIYIKAVIQVINPISLYKNRNLDVDAYFNNLCFLDVKKITKKYSVLEFDGMDDELTETLSKYNTVDEETGFGYRLSVVNAEPGIDARGYILQISKQQLEAGVRDNARKLLSNLTQKYEDAVMTQVVEGKLTELEAIEKIQAYKESVENKAISRTEHLLERDLMTGKEAKGYLKSILRDSDAEERKAVIEAEKNLETNCMGLFYDEGEQE